jgi:hypothetical protein
MALIVRRPDWPQRLYRATVAAMRRPHAWGAHDCATFASDCIEAMTGTDPMADLRGRYDSAVSAARVIVEAGASDLGELAAQRLPEIALAEARRGDVMLCKGPMGEFLAIVQGANAVGPAGFGLIYVPVSQGLRAYRVGV